MNNENKIENEKIIQDNDLIFYKDNNGIFRGGGFVIDSDMLKKDSSNENNSYIVPSGLYFTEPPLTGGTNNYPNKYVNKDAAVSDSLYERLLSLATHNDTPKKNETSKKYIKTKKNKKNLNKGKRKTKKVSLYH
jgi:hypothetical protein